MKAARLHHPSNLLTVLETRYGVGLAAAPVEALLWAAEAVADQHGVDRAKRELSAANRWRRRQGLVPAHAAYGSQLF